MSGEDKLTRAERVRLESFAQAINSAMAVRLSGEGQPAVNQAAIAGRIGGEPPITMDDLFRRAELIETWLKKARE